MDPNVRKLLLYFTGVLFGISVIVIVPLVYDAFRSGSWPVAEAIVTKNSISADAPGASDAIYYLDIEYQYKAGDKHYTSSNYGTQPRLSSRSKPELIKYQKSYPLGSVITIGFDPSRHDHARIQRGLAWYHMVGIACIAVLGLLFGGCLLIKPRQKQEEGPPVEQKTPTAS